MKVTTRVKGVKLAPSFNAKINLAAEQAASIVFPELNSAFMAAMGAEVWQWPRQTIRKGVYTKSGKRSQGTIVGSPRNIVDLGTLRASGSYTISGTLGTFTWSVGYATAVHNGARIHPWGDRSRPLVDLPPRPWTSAVLGTIDNPNIKPYPYGKMFKLAFISAYRKL
jgi:hypothetical protein